MNKQRPPLPGKADSFRTSLRFALDGLCHALRTERNMRIDWLLTVIVLCWNLAVRPPLTVVVAGLTACAAVLAAELLNTALERLIDLCAGGRVHPFARQAKDVSAAFVLLVAAGAVIVGVWMSFAAWPWQWRLFTSQHPAGAVVSGAVLALMLGVAARAAVQSAGSEPSLWREEG